MTFDFENLSDEFKVFYDAFSPETYGVSMGRAAEHAAIEFDSLSDKEKSLICEWFIELFEQKREYYGTPYFWVVEKINDSRFIPLLEDYYRRLKKRHNKIFEATIGGKVVRGFSNFNGELTLCKNVIKSLKRKKK